jgi:hypothetical protein
MAEDLTRAEFAQYTKDFEERLTVQLEETRSLLRLSLERLETGRESTERGFAELRRESQQLRRLLESRLMHVSHRVERIDRGS